MGIINNFRRGNNLDERFYVTDELIKLRMEMGLSRERLAAKCGVCSKTIQRAESGQRVRRCSIERMAKGLNIDKKILIDL